MSTDHLARPLPLQLQGQMFLGHRVALRLLTLQDCTETYLGWLQDPHVNRYLETRWQEQSLEIIRTFVLTMQNSRDSYLMAIVDRTSGRHIGNLKVGPVLEHHQCADLSYFIGERSLWGKGLATDAIRVACRLAFDVLHLHRLQAGVYESNIASCKALERAGFVHEGRLRKQLRGPTGWEDHLWYGMLREDFLP